jgi:hypothetical protein
MYVRVSVGFFFRPHVTVRRPLHELWWNLLCC